MSDPEFDNVRRLLRLKRYENPGDDYFERFLAEFQRRQRAELLQRTAHSIFFERIATYFSGTGHRGWAYAAGGAYLSVMLAIVLWPREQGEAGMAARGQAEADGTLWSGKVQLAPVRYSDDAGPFGPSGIDLDDAGTFPRRPVMPSDEFLLRTRGANEVPTIEF